MKQRYYVTINGVRFNPGSEISVSGLYEVYTVRVHDCETGAAQIGYQSHFKTRSEALESALQKHNTYAFSHF